MEARQSHLSLTLNPAEMSEFESNVTRTVRSFRGALSVGGTRKTHGVLCPRAVLRSSTETVELENEHLKHTGGCPGGRQHARDSLLSCPLRGI